MSERRLAAIMFTDIVGYTTIMGKDEDAAFQLLRQNRQLQRSLIEKYHGEWLKEMGDGILASFHSASNAVRCAGEIQQQAKNEDIPLRIGIHEGEVVFERGDVLGDGVNITSRLEEFADEGCIIISGEVYKNIRNKTGIRAEFVEEKFLKNVDETVKIYKVCCDEIPSQKSSQSFTEKMSPDKKSIIVLPFENLSPDPENAFFADGLTDELITELSKVHGLLVISRTSAMLFKGAQKSIPEIAREVNVKHVLEGSVRRAGNHVRITAQLIDAVTDTHLWAESYSGTLDDIFDLQEKLARRIVEALKGKLTPEEDRKLSARPLNDPQVYDIWLQAKQELWKFTKDGIERAQELLKNALDIVGDNALLYAGLSYTCWAAYDFGISIKEETLDEGEKYAQMSLAIDPKQPLALLGLGLMHYKRGDMFTTIINTIKAKKLGLESNVAFLGFLLAEVGKIQEAYHHAEDFILSNPLSFFSSWQKACVYIFDGKFETALTIFHEAEKRLNPQEAIFDWWMAQAAAFAGKEDEARKVFKRIVNMRAGALSDFSRLFLQAMKKNKKGVYEVLESTILKDMAETDEWFPNYLANCLIQVGENEQALYYLEHAVNWGFSNYRFLTEHNRYLKPLRDDLRFKSLINMAKEKQEKFVV